MEKEKFPIKSWKWVFYILGWLFGVTNLLFWLIQVIRYYIRGEDYPNEKFFSASFHKTVFWWGLIITLISLIVIIFLIL